MILTGATFWVRRGAHVYAGVVISSETEYMTVRVLKPRENDMELVFEDGEVIDQTHTYTWCWPSKEKGEQ